MNLHNRNKNKIFLLEEIIKKNFAARYKESVLGIFWSILKPLLIMIILTIIFSTLFGRAIENYPVYLLSGKIIYDFFNSGTTIAMNSIKSNQNILQKTAAPKYVFVIGSVISESLNFLITLIILIVVMIVTKAPFHIETIPLAIIPLLFLIAMITGIGSILSILCVYYTDIKHLWSVVTMMLMYGCAIFYPMDIIPEPYHQYMILNPIFWVIDQFRDLAVYGVFPNALNMINAFILSMIILIFGVIVFNKFEKRITLKF